MRCEETRHGHTYTYLTSAQVSELRGVWRHIHSIKRPVWTGARGHSRETWEAWRIAIAGYAGGKRPYPLLRQEYATPDVPTASTTADQRRAYETHEHNTVLVVPPGTSYEGVSTVTGARCEHGGNPDGRKAWLKLVRMYGGREQDERPVQLLLERNFEISSSTLQKNRQILW